MHPLANLRQKCFFAIMLIGGIAGLYEYSWDHQGALFNFFCGLIVVTFGSFAGSFVGFFIKNCVRYFRGVQDYAGDYNDGILLGSLFGSIVGIAGQMALGSAPHTALGAGVGSLLGGFIGALPDETMLTFVLTSMYEEEALPEIIDIADSCDL